MLEVLETGKLSAISAGAHVVDKVLHRSHSAEEAAKYRYCTLCLIRGKGIDRAALQNRLAPFGDSLLVIGSNKKARIHIHSNEPEKAFGVAARFGDVVHKKMENMRAQYEQKQRKSIIGEVALVTDSIRDLPAEFLRENNVYIVPVNFRIDDKNFASQRTDLAREIQVEALLHKLVREWIETGH